MATVTVCAATMSPCRTAPKFSVCGCRIGSAYPYTVPLSASGATSSARSDWSASWLNRARSAVPVKLPSVEVFIDRVMVPDPPAATLSEPPPCHGLETVPNPPVSESASAPLALLSSVICSLATCPACTLNGAAVAASAGTAGAYTLPSSVTVWPVSTVSGRPLVPWPVEVSASGNCTPVKSPAVPVSSDTVTSALLP